MKHLLSCISFVVLFALSSLAQEIKTKDGMVLGKLSDLVRECEKGAATSMMKFEGMEVDTHKYCTCVMQTLMPTITSTELMDAVSQDKMKDFLLQDKNFAVIKSCLEGNYTLTKDFRMKADSDPDGLARAAMIKECVSGLVNATDSKDWTEERARYYCNCTVDKLMEKGFSMSDLEALKNKNSELFNELVVPCVTEALSDKRSHDEPTLIRPRGSDLRGGGDLIRVPLVDVVGNSYKVKVGFGDLMRYFTLDTGASDMTIDRDMERELLLAGKLKKENYLGKKSYQLADGKLVEAQVVTLDDIVIGDVHVDQVKVAILDTGGYLLGKSFLEKFARWEMDGKEKVLTLYKK